MSTVEITSVSSKGQLVIPLDIRNQLKITVGTKLFVMTDGENILLKPVEEPRMNTFNKLISQSRKIVKEKGLKKSDLAAIIKESRHG